MKRSILREYTKDNIYFALRKIFFNKNNYCMTYYESKTIVNSSKFVIEKLWMCPLILHIIHALYKQKF